MTAKQRARVSEIEAELSQLRDDEQGKYDNLPESIQSSDRGEEFQTAIDALENAISELQNITSL